MRNRILAILLIITTVAGCKNTEDYFSKGLDLSAEGNYRSAIPTFDKAINENPYQKDAYIQMGLCYASLNQHDSAIGVYGRLLSIYPENTAANYYTGVSKYKLQKYGDAVIYFNHALDSKGGFNAADTNSIQALIDLYKDNFETETAEMDIPCHEILYDRAMANYKSGHFKNARIDFSNCIIQDYIPGTCYYMIGLCRLARKEVKFARQAFFQASKYGDSLALKKLSFLENPNPETHSPVRKKA